MKNRNRLALHNEELQWKLKQNSEKFQSTLSELSKSYQNQTNSLTESKKEFHSLDQNQSQVVSSTIEENTEVFDTNDLSYPSSPVVKGMVQKSDSVSWVLELNDDEPPETFATRMVKRNASFRSIDNKSATFKRCLSHDPNHASSVSTTPIRRSSAQNSKTDEHTKKSRLRSQSLTAEAQTKNVVRSVSGTVISESTAWEQPLSSSSPYKKHSDAKGTFKKSNPAAECSGLAEKSSSARIRIRSNSIPADIKYLSCDARSEQASKESKRNAKHGFATCKSDMPSLSRTDIMSVSYPNPSAQKVNKKCQEIKESAGEAMFSGNNSENELFSGTDSDSDSLSSASSDIISPSHYRLNRHYSIEEALMNKIAVSSGSTPMEVSWSEDADESNA